MEGKTLEELAISFLKDPEKAKVEIEKDISLLKKTDKGGNTLLLHMSKYVYDRARANNRIGDLDYEVHMGETYRSYCIACVVINVSIAMLPLIYCKTLPILLNHGSDPTHKNKKSETAIMYFCRLIDKYPNMARAIPDQVLTKMFAPDFYKKLCPIPSFLNNRSLGLKHKEKHININLEFLLRSLHLSGLDFLKPNNNESYTI